MSLLPSEYPQRFTLPLATWLGVQLVSFALSAFGIRLSYGWVDPPQRWAVEQMLVAQMAVASIILLASFRTLSFSISAFCTGAVMLTLANAMAEGETRMLESIEVLFIWILTIYLASKIQQDRVVSASLLLVVIGGALLQYTAIEFGGRDGSPIYSPTIAAIVIARHGWHMVTALSLIFPIFATLMAVLLTRRHPKHS